MDARSGDEAHEFRRSAEMIRGYQLETGGLVAIVEVEGRVAARSADGTLVVPVRSDHATLNHRVASLAEAMARAAGRDPEVERAHILFEGTLSADARAHLEAIGLIVDENALGGEHAAPEP